MTARALIAEDEPLLLQGLRDDLRALWPELQVVAAVADGDSALQAALAQRPQVCFLDIRMPGASGLEVAQALAEDWPDGEAFPLLVFVTAYDQYALQAFDAQAVDYLVKPLQRERLAECVQRLRARLAERTPADALPQAMAQLRGLLAAVGARGTTERLEVIQAAVGNTVHLVPVDEVVYFEAADKYVRVLAGGREFLIRTPLKELLPQLDPEVFWQIHRGTVVRADAIDRVTRDEAGKWRLTLRGLDEAFVVSRLYADRFRAM